MEGKHLSKIVVGLTTRDCRVHLQQDAVGVLRTYARTVAQFEMMPILLPYDCGIADYIEFCDAFVVPGGEDTILSLGEFANASSRDEFEIEIVKRAYEKQIPVLGICRGMHLLNVALGGAITLVSSELRLNHRSPESNGSTCHQLVLEPEDGLWGNHTELRAAVPSRHSYSVDRIAEGARVVARADDGTIEAIRFANWDALGVQWHCEMRDTPLDAYVWQWLREAATNYLRLRRMT